MDERETAGVDGAEKVSLVCENEAFRVIARSATVRTYAFEHLFFEFRMDSLDGQLPSSIVILEP